MPARRNFSKKYLSDLKSNICKKKGGLHSSYTDACLSFNKMKEKTERDPCFSSFSLSFSDLFLPNLCMCRILLLHLITLNDTHSEGLLWTRDRPVAEISTWQHITPTRARHPFSGGIRTRNSSKRAAAELRLWPRGHWGRPVFLNWDNVSGLWQKKSADAFYCHEIRGRTKWSNVIGQFVRFLLSHIGSDTNCLIFNIYRRLLLWYSLDGVQGKSII